MCIKINVEFFFLFPKKGILEKHFFYILWWRTVCYGAAKRHFLHYWIRPGDPFRWSLVCKGYVLDVV